MATNDPRTKTTITTTNESRTRPDVAGSEFGWINIALGSWLFISAFIWRHTPTSATNTWLVGLLIITASIVAMYVPKVRYANTALAVWLFVSTLAIPHATSGTTWNNAIVAIIVFLVSLAPSGLQREATRPHRTAPV